MLTIMPVEYQLVSIVMLACQHYYLAQCTIPIPCAWS